MARGREGQKIARAKPERMNRTAVSGFIATKPGSVRLSGSISNCHATRTSRPTEMGTPLATAGKARNATGRVAAPADRGS